MYGCGNMIEIQDTETTTDDQIKIMVYCASPWSTYGTSKVMREVYSRIGKDPRFAVHYYATDYHGVPLKRDGMHIYPSANFKRGTKEWVDHVATHINMIKPDYFFIFTDGFILFKEGMHSIDMSKAPTKTIGYFNCDTEIVPEGSKAVGKKCDRIIVSSEYTKEQYKKDGFDADVIWHGVDTEYYKPVSNPAQKAVLRGEYGIDNKDYVYLFIGRNGRRKNIPALLDAFSDICYDYPNMKLLLHVPNFNELFENLVDYINRNIADRIGKNPLADGKIIFNPKALGLGKGCDDNEVLKLYQVADCYVTSASGEGFGMPITEAMSCGLPVIAPNNTTTPELLLNEEADYGIRGVPVKADHRYCVGLSATHYLIDEKDLAKKMEFVYNNKDAAELLGKNGRKFCEERLQWDEKAKQFMDIFDEEMKNPKVLTEPAEVKIDEPPKQ